MPDIVLGNGTEKRWIRYLKSRIKNNKNALVFVSGPTGSGKSFSCLRIFEELDPDAHKMTAEEKAERVIFSKLELMQLVNSGKLRRGSVMVFEEMGVNMSNREWQDKTNRVISFLIQTFRHRNFVLLMNGPFMDFTDSQLVKLFHAELQTLSINYETKQVRLKPMLLQYNPRKKKFYYKYLRLIAPESMSGAVPITIWNVDLPSKDFLHAYEAKKTAFTNRLNKEIQEELEERDRSKKAKKELTDTQQNVVDKLKDGQLVQQIAMELGIDVRNVYLHMVQIRKKGVKIQAVRAGNSVARYNVF